MGDNTARANLYLPGGGSTGLIMPPEPVDIDKINDNMKIIDRLLGAFPCTSTTRPSSPIDGQLIYETDTANVLVYRLSETAWRPVGTPNCPSEAYRNAIFPAQPVGMEAYRSDKNWTERFLSAAQVNAGGEGWYPVSGALPSITFTGKAGFNPPVGQTWGMPTGNWDVKVQGGVVFSPPGDSEMFKVPFAGDYELKWHVSSYGTSGGTAKFFGVMKGAIPNSDLSGNALLVMEDERPYISTKRQWLDGSMVIPLLKDDIMRFIFVAVETGFTFNHAAPYKINRVSVRYLGPSTVTT